MRRAKGGIDSTHPLGATELRALRKLQRAATGIYVFVNERGTPWDVAGYQRMIARTAKRAGFPFPVSSHALRHGCGYKLASDGQDTRALAHYLGHRSLDSTAIYTALAPGRFKGFWRDCPAKHSDARAKIGFWPKASETRRILTIWLLTLNSLVSAGYSAALIGRLNEARRKVGCRNSSGNVPAGCSGNCCQQAEGASGDIGAHLVRAHQPSFSARIPCFGHRRRRVGVA